MTLRTPRPRVLEVALALALGTGAAACAGSRGAPAESPVELQIAPLSSMTDGGIVTTGEQASGRCSVRLVAARIQKSSPGCYLDSNVDKEPGLLFYPCGGDGPAEAVFGDQRYTGRVNAGEVELELGTELDWEDGCHWGTHAVITGTLVSNGEPALKKLTWQYQDRVITGSDCSGVCSARTSIEVTSTKGRAPEMPPVSDDEDDDD